MPPSSRRLRAVIGQVATIANIWHAIDWRRLAPTLLAGLVGVPIGLLLLPYVSLSAFKLTVGIVLILYCSFMLLAGGRIKIIGGKRRAEMAVGFVGGILGGIAGLSGPVPTIWTALKRWQKQERRVFLQVFNVTILSAMLTVSLVQGLMTARSCLALGVALPGTLIGSSLGLVVYRRFDDRSRSTASCSCLLLASGFGSRLVQPLSARLISGRLVGHKSVNRGRAAATVQPKVDPGSSKERP